MAVAKKAPVKKSASPAENTTEMRSARNQRIEEIRQRRSRRTSRDISGFSTKLGVPENRKDPNWEYRWVLDKEVRIQEMRNKDWDMVSDEEIRDAGVQSDVGSVVKRVGNERTTDKVQNMVLMRKPREFYKEDKAQEQRQIDELERDIKRGKTASPEGLIGDDPHSYVPGGGDSTVKISKST